MNKFTQSLYITENSILAFLKDKYTIEPKKIVNDLIIDIYIKDIPTKKQIISEGNRKSEHKN